MSLGRLGSSPSFWRRRETWTSMERSKASSAEPRHHLHQLLAGEDPPGAHRQRPEEVELVAGEQDLRAVERHAPCRRIEVERADRDDLAPRPGAPARPYG